MLDQSFSAHNFEIIFTIENRKGHVDITTMSTTYQDILGKIKDIRVKARDIRKKKKLDRTSKEVSDLKKFDLEIKNLQKEKAEALAEDMASIADEVNSHSFKFKLNKHLYGDKEEFTLENSRASYYAMKQLLHNMKRTFKIEMLGRHQIMTAIKHLLNMSMPIFIIRTDVQNFYESIPQDALFQKVYDNNLLSFKSKSFIKQIFYAYETIKDPSKTSSNKGVPRGIGISAMLSELYMQDIDKELKSRTGVIFYVRYVDDIFMILTSLGSFKDLNEYYQNMQDFFKSKGLNLQPIGSDKCKLIEYSPGKLKPISFDYLGYKINLSKPKKLLIAKYSLSDKKIKKINDRIEKAFKHFETLSKIDIKAARRDLLDSLNYITGNFRLSNSKSHAKAGLYYSNDLLDNLEELDQFTATLHSHAITPYSKLFPKDDKNKDKDKFIDALSKHIKKIDFKQRWIARKMYNFSLSRIAEISSWL